MSFVQRLSSSFIVILLFASSIADSFVLVRYLYATNSNLYYSLDLYVKRATRAAFIWTTFRCRCAIVQWRLAVNDVHTIHEIVPSYTDNDIKYVWLLQTTNKFQFCERREFRHCRRNEVAAVLRNGVIFSINCVCNNGTAWKSHPKSTETPPDTIFYSCETVSCFMKQYLEHFLHL